MGDSRVIVKEVGVVKVSSLASNRDNLYKFMHVFLRLSVLLKPNILIKFKLINIFKPPLASLFLFLNLFI